MKISRLSQRISPSKTLAVTARVAELKRKGVEVIDLGAGEPDFQTPATVAEAGIRAIQEGHTKYTPNQGIFALREAVCHFLKALGGSYQPDEILICCGAKHAVYNALMAVLDPGDEVLIPAPYWTSYPEQVRMTGAEPVFVMTDESNAFKITAETLKKSITAKTKLLIFNSPSNPTGAAYTRAELDDIANVLQHAETYVLSDEIYIQLVYDGRKPVSLASYPEIADRLLLVNGVSKSHSMTGWRIGYLAAREPIIGAARKIQSHCTSNASSISQYAALAALNMPEQELTPMLQAFEARRNLIIDGLTRIDGIQVQRPGGAFYVFPNVAAYFKKSAGDRMIASSVDLATYLLETARVALVPGEAFGAPNNVRISYANSVENLEEAVRRIDGALRELQ